MAQRGQGTENKKSKWIWEVIEFLLAIAEIILYIPRLVFRLLREF